MLARRRSVSPLNRSTAYDYIAGAAFLLVLLIVLYPLYRIVIASFSNPNAVDAGRVWFWPVGITLVGYRRYSAFPPSGRDTATPFSIPSPAQSSTCLSR